MAGADDAESGGRYPPYRPAKRVTTDRRAWSVIWWNRHDPAIGRFARRTRTALRATLEISDAMVAPIAT